MSYFIARRTVWRPDQPEPVYKGALNLWEAPLYVSIEDEQRSSRLTDSAVGDRTYLLQYAPTTSWIPAQVNRLTVASWAPVFSAEFSYQSTGAAQLDVRGQEWTPQPAWIRNIVDTVVASWTPIFDAEVGYRSSSGPTLDVRTQEWSPSFSWVRPVVDAIVASWVPIFYAEESFRSRSRASLDVRTQEWSAEFGWARSVVDAIVASWTPIFDAETSFRSEARHPFDVRRPEWSPELGWLFSAVNVVVASWTPVFASQLLQSSVIRAAKFPLLGQSSTWIFSALGPTQSQIWPAVLQGMLASRLAEQRVYAWPIDMAFVRVLGTPFPDCMIEATQTVTEQERSVTVIDTLRTQTAFEYARTVTFDC